MLNRLLTVVLVLLAAFVGVAYFLPATHHVERSISVERPAPVVFTLLNSYRSFNRWSPWAARDPDARYEMSGPDSGVGARLSWSGDPRVVGTGWQQITASEPYERIAMHLDFGAQGEADSYFLIAAGDGASTLTWGFDTDVTAGQSLFGRLMGKYFGLFLERWVGADYEEGLAAFKSYAEALPGADFSAADIVVLEVQAMDILYVEGQSSQAADDVTLALADAFSEVSRFIVDNGVEMAGQPMAITRAWDESGYRFDAAIPVAKLPAATTGNVRAGRSPAGRAVRYTHRGPYANMLRAYDELASYMAAHGLSEGPVSWEHYVSDPGETPEEDLLTHIYFLLGD